MSIGAAGAIGVTRTLEDAGPVPAALLAVTVQSYGTPLVRPVTVTLSAVVVAVTGSWPAVQLAV